MSSFTEKLVNKVYDHNIFSKITKRGPIFYSYFFKFLLMKY